MLVNHPNRHAHGEQEHPVAPRFSFANSGLMRRDDIMKNNGEPSVRTLVYPTPPDEALKVRQGLIDRGVVMGEQIDGHYGTDRFIIPSSARPISYDAAVNTSGDFTYNDGLLFFDLGKLLGIVADEGSELPLMLHDAVGQNIATKGFTRLYEPKILLVPGFEFSVHTVEDDDTALNHYMHSLHTEFGKRFKPHVDQFVEGFRTILG